AERIAKVTANIYTHNVGPRQTRYYWLRHTRGINVGDWYQQQGLSAETGADIDAELALLNEKLGQNIIEEVFDTAMPARKLEMTKTVARIDNPAENIGYNQVYNEADGKLYVWDGNKYTAKVQAVDLEGKLASSQLDQALINQLTQASSTADNALSKANTVQSALAQEATQRTQAIQAETRARTTAISAEATARTQALQAEANARGTAVSRLEQADREQAQLITTATTKADNALSGLSEERQARIAGDNAQAQARAILTTKVASVESGISTLQNSVASANRSVSELSQSLNAKIDGIAIGGWNLIKNSRLLNNTTHWNVIGGRDVRNGIAVLKNLNTANWYWRQGFNLPKKQYTFSAEVKPERTAFYLHLQNGEKWVNFYARNLTPGIWQKISITFVSAIRNISFINPGQGLIELQNPMLVEGNRAMTWAPAPEDIEQSISAVSAELTSYKSTQATKEQAQATQISGLTTRLGNAESSLSTTSQAITTLNGTVSTMHTIQAVSIAGNRKALAGISLGSNGGTESSVIVMADKFNVVKNARDGNVKPMFSVVNNKVAINGDLMADGIVSARMMGANSIATGSIQGGAIRANHVAVGEISTEKLASEAVTTEKIRSNTITSDKIGAGQIITNHMVAGSIDGKILRAGTVTADKVVASVSLQSPVIRGGILEVGRLIGGNLYEVKSFTLGARNQMSITIKPSIAQRLLKMTWDYGTVRFSGNSAAIGGTGDWVTSIKNSAGTVSQHLKGFYTLVIPSNTQVTLSLTFNTTRIMNQILVETVVYSGSSYIQ
ncbi:phage tail tip fiber protein, partial [Glaesserella parasuis]